MDNLWKIELLLLQLGTGHTEFTASAKVFSADEGCFVCLPM